jgi:hypothetical protein
VLALLLLMVLLVGCHARPGTLPDPKSLPAADKSDVGNTVTLSMDKILAQGLDQVVFVYLYDGNANTGRLGVFTDYEKLFGRGLKILMLGYKRFGRGEAFYNTRVEGNIAEAKALLPTMVDKFACVSFDNLALSQLDVKSLVSKEEYEMMFMGDDGSGSMYIDLVSERFAVSSTSLERYPITSDIVSMFRKIRV